MFPTLQGGAGACGTGAPRHPQQRWVPQTKGAVQGGGRGARPYTRVNVEVFPSQDEDSEFTLASDFEIGHFFRERVVPRAVLYFTGEAIEDNDSVCGRGLRGSLRRRGAP